MAYGYMTLPWVELAAEQVRTDPKVRKATEGIDLRILSILANAPPECFGFLYVEFEQGRLKEYRVSHTYDEITEGMSTPTFVVSGDFPVFLQIHRGELGEKAALLRGKLHLTGSLTKALRYLRPLEAITASLQQVPTRDLDEEGFAGVS